MGYIVTIRAVGEGGWGNNGPKLVPPGGHHLGMFARNDMGRGVRKAPVNEVVRGAKYPEFKITEGEQDILNPRGMNVLRSLPAGGTPVLGARKTSHKPNRKYINVRRLLRFLEKSIEEGRQWVVFEPNNE